MHQTALADREAPLVMHCRYTDGANSFYFSYSGRLERRGHARATSWFELADEAGRRCVLVLLPTLVVIRGKGGAWFGARRLAPSHGWMWFSASEVGDVVATRGLQRARASLGWSAHPSRGPTFPSV